MPVNILIGIVILAAMLPFYIFVTCASRKHGLLRIIYIGLTILSIVVNIAIYDMLCTKMIHVYPGAYTLKTCSEKTWFHQHAYNSDATIKYNVAFYLTYTNKHGETIRYGAVETEPYSQFVKDTILNVRLFSKMKKDQVFVYTGYAGPNPVLVIPDEEYKKDMENIGDGKTVKGGSLNW